MDDPQKQDNISVAAPSSEPGSAAPVHSQKADTSVKLEQILLKQFDFASQTAQAVRQDSSQMIYFYWVMFGVLAAGLGFLLQLGGNAPAQRQAAGVASYAQLLMLLALLGAGAVQLAFYSRWVRLRRRYTDCFAFMTGISTFYIQRFERAIPELATLLAWQPESTGMNASLGAFFFTVYSLLPVLGSLFFAGAAIMGGEVWLQVNGGALFPLPANLPLYGIAAGVFVLSLIVFFASGRAMRSDRKTHIPVLGDI
ncbi:MAG TPA: hypothetical protein VMV29_11235 [Ktedonobacterales bacterium]|nr:hypothetical protein [Ktedonobacterales bacterium]